MGFTWAINCRLTETAYNADCDCIESVYGCSSGYDYSLHECCNIEATTFWHIMVYFVSLTLVICLISCAIVLCRKKMRSSRFEYLQAMDTLSTSVIEPSNVMFESTVSKRASRQSLGKEYQQKQSMAGLSFLNTSRFT